ncbi:MAG: acyltransferase family protein [Hyphomicrobiaceae bacterium]
MLSTLIDNTRPRRSEGLVEAKPSRIISVDVLRGFAIFWIVGGDGIAWSLRDMSRNSTAVVAEIGEFIGDQFHHAPWEGFRFYDLIFPLFIFTTGVAIPLSLKRLVEREGSLTATLRVLRRSVLLFVLGLVYYGGASSLWPHVRLLGVLQRIAICYLLASILFLSFGVRGLLATIAIVLVGYWALLTFVPVPGIGAGSYEKSANLAFWVDQNYLPGKKWAGNWDPEGLLSTLPAAATCLIGVIAGLALMRQEINSQKKSLYLIFGGAIMVASGYLWGLQFPIIKGIWTSSFVLVAGGYSLILLGAMHQLIDVWHVRRWSIVFVWIGANAVTIYFLNNVIYFEGFANRFVGGDIAAFFDNAIASGTGRLIGYAGGLTVAILIARLLYARQIYLRV